MRLRKRHWVVALGMAALAHAGLAGLFHEPVLPPVGAKAMGLSGIEIAFAPAGGPGGVAEMVTPSTDSARDVQSPNAVETVQAVQSERVLAAQPASATPATRVPAPQPLLATASPLATTPSEPSASPAAPTLAELPTHAQASAARGTNGKSGTQDWRELRDGQDDAGGGVAGIEQDYLTQLSAWLERHKEYPQRARRRRQEGTVYLRFSVDPAGTVLSYQIERSSGYSLLDHEVENMIRRAAPLPAMPQDLVQARLELVVPVSFYLR